MREIRGFTLIELSIVLVIIGLIVGGILLGQDLIKAAEVRAQISQIEKYNQAVNTFKGKFGGLPGDLALTLANQFGFTGASCNGITGRRDGNGIIEGTSGLPVIQTTNETALFWMDLSSAVAGALIDVQVPNNGAIQPTCAGSFAMSLTPGSTYVGDYFPTSKVGQGFVYVYAASGYNWFGVSAITAITAGGGIKSNATIPVIHAYNMDNKVDDALPTTGSVQAVYLAGGSVTGTTLPNSNTADSPTTCYNTTSNAYSLSSLASYGVNGNCALSFRFQ